MPMLKIASMVAGQQLFNNVMSVGSEFSQPANSLDMGLTTPQKVNLGQREQ